MRISKHAIRRCSQRGIPEKVLGIIQIAGAPVRKPGNAYEIAIRRADREVIIAKLHHLIRDIERTAGKAVLTDKNGDVITVYNLR